MISRLVESFAGRKALFGIVCVMLVGGVVYAETGGHGFDMSLVAVTGDLSEAQRAEIYERLVADKRQIEGIGDIKATLDRVSWIQHVNVMRHWPDRITIAVFEEKPIAWWNGSAFIDDNGDVFRSPYVAGSGLARLYGPEGREKEVMEQYQQLARSLGRTGRSVSTLKLDARGAWEFATADGIRVMLGKDDIMDRFQRFLTVLDSKPLASRTGDIKQIDTRYSNGVAVSWKEIPTGLKVAKTDNY